MKAIQNLEFVCGNIEDPQFCATISGKFDFVVLSDTVGYLDDCQAVFTCLPAGVIAPHGRLVVAYYGHWWQPLLTIAEKLRMKMPHLPQNWLTTDDLRNLFELSDIEMCRRDWRQLVPRRLFGNGPLDQPVYCAAAPHSAPLHPQLPGWTRGARPRASSA